MINLKPLRQGKGLSMREAAKQMGISYTTYVNYEKGIREPNSETLIVLANFYGVSVDYLVGNPVTRKEIIRQLPNIEPVPKMGNVPLIGTIACGTPILAEENVEGDVDIPEHIHADFALRCKGDSMINARIFDGDIVYIRQQETVESGEIAAVLLGDEATLKRVILYADHISLEPENPQYRPIVKWGEEMNEIRILGKAVAFTSCL